MSEKETNTIDQQNEEIITKISEEIYIRTGLEIAPEHIQHLLIKVQEEQLKNLVYQCFLSIKKKEAQEQEESAVSEEMPGVK